MAYSEYQQTIEELARLDFAGKGESFVEQRFLTPLLKCLGYETHKDYEVVRHGDEGAGFKLRYPPVEKGAQRVKTYDPDYIPTIRKKMFWIIEAKSPKNVSYPFADNYTVQGLQYCIHPEIQAKYLVVTNGRHTVVHDAHGSVFLEQDPYRPILTFEASELPAKWSDVYDLLSVEKLRNRIEADLKAMYDKLCLSSLDEQYPQEVWRRIGTDAAKHAQAIKAHVIQLYVEDMDRTDERWRNEIERLSSAEILELMEAPLRGGASEANYYVAKVLAEMSAAEVFDTVTRDFDEQTIFRKEQSVVAAAVLYRLTEDQHVKTRLTEFFETVRNYDLPLLNQVECALLRLTRKWIVLTIYPALHQRIGEELKSLPELMRHVRPPSALENSYAIELERHAQSFVLLSRMADQDLSRALSVLLRIEKGIEAEFRRARDQLPDRERQIGGFEGYGIDGSHYAFRNILANYGLQSQ